MKLAIIFPGQGSQKLAMVSDLYHSDEITQFIFSRANQILGYDLRDIIDHHQDKLNQTQFTQPALFVSSYVLWQGLSEKFKNEVKPLVFAGHSLGEYNALAASEAISFEDGLRLVAKRAELMAEPSNQSGGASGSMAAVLGLDVEKIIEICNQFNGKVSAANFNSVEQTVIAGETRAVNLASEKLRQAGAKRVIILPVSIASHCHLMKPAAEKFAQFLDSIEIRSPTIPVLHNVDYSSHSEPEVIKKALVDQLYSPVRWHQTILKLKESYQINQLVECGPAKVLSSLANKTKLFEQVISINNEPSLNEFLNQK